MAQESFCDKSGLLLKESEYLRRWDARYWRLSGHKLQYWEDAQEWRSVDAKGSYDLEGAAVSVSEEDGGVGGERDGPIINILLSSNKEYRLRCVGGGHANLRSDFM